MEPEKPSALLEAFQVEEVVAASVEDGTGRTGINGRVVDGNLGGE